MKFRVYVRKSVKITLDILCSLRKFCCCIPCLKVLQKIYDIFQIPTQRLVLPLISFDQGLCRNVTEALLKNDIFSCKILYITLISWNTSFDKEICLSSSSFSCCRDDGAEPSHKWHVYVTGHSLGGALATLFALELSSSKLAKWVIPLPS